MREGGREAGRQAHADDGQGEEYTAAQGQHDGEERLPGLMRPWGRDDRGAGPTATHTQQQVLEAARGVRQRWTACATACLLFASTVIFSSTVQTCKDAAQSEGRLGVHDFD